MRSAFCTSLFEVYEESCYNRLIVEKEIKEVKT